MQVAPPISRPVRRRRDRLTVAAAALAVLGVLTVPPAVATLFELVVPVDRHPQWELTEAAGRVAALEGANVLQDSVVVTLTPAMDAPVMRPSRRVLPEESAGYLVPLGVSGVLPMRPELAPTGAARLVAGLEPSDKVFANLGPLVVGCLPTRADPPDECTPVLLTQHSTGYFRFPAAWGSATFLEAGTAMEAQSFGIVGGRVVVGGLPGDAARVAVTLHDGSRITAFTTPSASPGDTVWWASTTKRPVAATAYDAEGGRIAAVDLGR